MKPRILISGATGNIGRQLTARLVDAGYRISALHRSTVVGDSTNVSWIRTADLATHTLDPAIGRGIDVYIHLAASLRPIVTNSTGAGFQTAAIASNLSTFVAEAAIPRVVVLSSIAASLAERDSSSARRYGIEKLAADKIFLERLGSGRQLVILRPPAVYGPGMHNSLSILAKLIHKGLPIPLGLATEPRHYISVRNLCDLILSVVGGGDQQWASASGRIFEPSDGRAISTRDLVKAMGPPVGRTPRLLPVPTGVLRLIGSVTGRSEMISGALDRLDVAPVEQLEAAFGWSPIEQMPESLSYLRDPSNFSS